MPVKAYWSWSASGPRNTRQLDYWLVAGMVSPENRAVARFFMGDFLGVTLLLGCSSEAGAPGNPV